MTNKDRFWSRVNKTDTCWLWTAGVSSSGYGQITISGRILQAHRVSYEMLVGDIGHGLQLDHLCRVRRCVNPTHLEQVTSRQNTLRGSGPAAVHARQTHCIYGHEFTKENTTVNKGKRSCRACKQRRNRSRYAKNDALPSTSNLKVRCYIV